MIDSFRGKYAFLSNFYRVTFRWRFHTWPSSEHAFQAAKADNLEDFFLIKHAPSPSAAKKLGRRVKMRSNWDRIRVDEMRSILVVKFEVPQLYEWLLQTGDEELVEGNHWGDTFWGVCNGEGENHLGKLLMEIRDGC